MDSAVAGAVSVGAGVSDRALPRSREAERQVLAHQLWSADHATPADISDYWWPALGATWRP